MDLSYCLRRASRRRVDELMQNLASFSRGAQLQMEAVTHYHQVLLSFPPSLFPPFYVYISVLCPLPLSLLHFFLSLFLPLSPTPPPPPPPPPITLYSTPLPLSSYPSIMTSLLPQPSAILISSSDGGVTGEDGEEEVCVVGSVEYYSGFCLDWRGVPMREVGGGGKGGGGRDIEWKPNDDTSVLYPKLHVCTHYVMLSLDSIPFMRNGVRTL